MYEGTKNDISKCTFDAITLGPVENMQGGIQYFSLEIGRILQRI